MQDSYGYHLVNDANCAQVDSPLLTALLISLRYGSLADLVMIQHRHVYIQKDPTGLQLGSMRPDETACSDKTMLLRGIVD